MTQPAELIQTIQINVAQLLKQPTEATRQYIITQVPINHLDEDLTILAPLSGTLKLIKAGRTILVTATFTTALQLACTRCLTPVNVPITFDLEETFTPTTDIISGVKITPEQDTDTDPATLITDQHILDLSEVIRQALYLNQPGHILCRKNCQGLCPYCGQNKNLGNCTCQETQIDNRLSGLLALKNTINNPYPVPPK